MPEKYILDETAVEEQPAEVDDIEIETTTEPEESKSETEIIDGSESDDLSIEDVEKAKEVIDKLATNVEDNKEEETKEEDNLEG